ncbi:alpha/beta hydrolase [Pseudonocardia sp. NPDC049635]|uniref:alpha/beta fold hydrolase n=1 Tax=Pseudonocardia sp. NPDC049635 TaxID=3155506 RepID=UPI0033C16222
MAVPGLGLSVQGWAPTLSRLGPGRGTAAVALPAFGAPARRGTALDPATSAERLLGHLDDLGTGPVALLGHSASCQVVVEAARSAPDRVTALVLVGPTTDPAARSWASMVRRWVRTVRGEPLHQVPQLLRDYAHSGLAGFVRALDRSRRHRIEQMLPALEHPVLLVRGDRDRLCPRGWLDRLAERPAPTSIRTVPGAAHMAPLTHPDELAAILRPFLSA